MTKNVIVFGGTGHQGSAFVRALAAANDPTHVHPAFAIHVLVRDPEAHSAERLIKLPGVKLVHSPHYMEAPDEAFDAAGLSVGDVHGAFMVNGYMDGDKETAQGGLAGINDRTNRQASGSSSRQRRTASSTLSMRPSCLTRARRSATTGALQLLLFATAKIYGIS